MNRAKHITMLVFKILFIILCFAIASVFTVLQSIPLNRFDKLKNKIGLDACEILVMNDNGASLSYEVVDGKINFDIKQNGDNYDDLIVLITFPKITYDSSEMRDYLYETIGDRAEKEEEYLKAMEEGPWKTNLSFKLTGNTEGVNSKNTIYTITDPDLNENTDFVKMDNDESSIMREVYAENNEELTFMLTFGAKSLGALKSGKYTFSAELSMAGLYDNNARLSFLTTMNVITSVCGEAIRDKGLNIFKVENWLTFYGVMVVIGMFIYLWRDLRAMLKIFSAITDSMGEGVRVIVHTYINGAYAGSREEIQGGPSIFAALIISILCFMVFVLTIPIRIIIFIIRDIVFLFIEDYDLDEFSYIGNILGSVGIYVLIFGLVGLLSASVLLGGICTVVGIIMCIVASILCKRKEEY